MNERVEKICVFGGESSCRDQTASRFNKSGSVVGVDVTGCGLLTSLAFMSLY